MNVFILCTGRCGSTTFIKACGHIRNFTSAHEAHSGLLGQAHFQYPPNHIEADNRLSWFLGRLEQAYGNEAFYVHLTRDRLETAKSFLNRTGIMRAYSKDILLKSSPNNDPLEVCLDYCDTVNTNIEFFLRNKSKKMAFTLENAKEDFRVFWELIGAEGDLSAALAEWDYTYNATALRKPPKPLVVRAYKRVKRVVKAWGKGNSKKNRRVGTTLVAAKSDQPK